MGIKHPSLNAGQPGPLRVRTTTDAPGLQVQRRTAGVRFQTADNIDVCL